MDAHLGFCAALIAQSHFAQAAAHCEQILAHDPTLVGGHIHLAVARIGEGDVRAAFAAVRRALRIAETPEGRMLFAQCLQNLPSIADDDDGMRDLLIRAMSEPWGRPSELARHYVNLIKANSEIAACIDRATAAWPARLPGDRLFGEAGLHAAANDMVLRCLLENARVTDLGLERFLAAARSVLLETASAEKDIEDAAFGFYCALARQCFINEYVFAHAQEELQQADELRQRLVTALRDNTPVPASWPVAVAAYFPLHTLEQSERLLALPWPDGVDAQLTLQVREPQEELRLRAAIPRLTPVQDGVSLLVQRQYEENPYPRWVKVAPSGVPSHINARLHGQFPYSAFRDIGVTDTVDVLVAGCGTGQQLVDIAQRIIGARVLAIDLSLPSLAYAKRQTEALGLRNIEYGQADILQLATLGRQFDVIDCAGVLHHLGDPLAGWNVLLSLLRPDGAMRVALYSEIARRQVVAARAFIGERGFGTSAEDIRRFRQEVFALPANHPVKPVARSGDFFSVSDCRDLVFHVQEHRFTLPQIKAFLAANNLNFLGFEERQSMFHHYSARFPHDRARTDLDLWHRYEQDNPWTFGVMYQFWVQRAGARS